MAHQVDTGLSGRLRALDGGSESGPHAGVGFRVELEVGVAHAGVPVDPPPDRAGPALAFGQVGTVVGGDLAGQPLTVVLEQLDGGAGRGGDQVVGMSHELGSAVVQAGQRPGGRVDVLGADAPVGQGVVQAGHRRAGAGPPGNAPTLPAGAAPIATEQSGRRRRPALGGQVPVAQPDAHVQRVEEGTHRLHVPADDNQPCGIRDGRLGVGQAPGPARRST